MKAMKFVVLSTFLGCCRSKYLKTEIAKKY